MPFDIVLPSALFFLTAMAVYLYPKLETKVKSILEEKKFTVRDVVMLVVVMGVAVTVLVVIPAYAIMIIFLIFYSFMLFMSVYVLVPKWYLAVLVPATFLALYFALWNASSTDLAVIIFMDVFAAVFLVFASVYLGTLFDWKTVAVFAGLLTVMDILQVWGTGHMIESSIKIVGLKLPIMIHVPTFPYQSSGMNLGLGDIMLSSLLTIQTARKYGKKFAYVLIAFIAGAFLIFEVFQIWYYELQQQYYPLEEAARNAAMPATIFIVCGWLAALGARYLYNWVTAKKAW